MNQSQQAIVWGRILRESLQALSHGRFKDAAALLRPVIGGDARKASLWLHYRQALVSYAFALYQMGEVGQALVYQTKALAIAPDDSEARGNFLLLLKAGTENLPDSAEFRHVLHSALQQTDIGEYAVVAAQALLKDSAFTTVFQRLLSADPEQIVKSLSQGRLRAMMQTPLLLLLLRNTLIPLAEFENVFRRLRKALFLAYTAQADAKEALHPGRIEAEFISALAQYVWLTDYAIPEDAEETALVGFLQQRLEADQGLLTAAVQSQLGCFALYRSWLQLPNCEQLLVCPITSWKSHWQPLAQEWRLCLQEQSLAGQIQSLTSITGDISERVQQQYEENPFPRWKHDPVAADRSTAEEWLAGFAPGLSLPLQFKSPIEVLTAGCGTGLEPISLARQIEIRRYLAFDLSRASLAYAQRMAWKLGLADAIEFKQADLTQLGGLSERFDLITASGVLHHLENPQQGWQILTGLLKPGGVMLVSLYSESARHSVIKARQVIAKNAWQATPQTMRQMRAAVMAGEHVGLEPLLLWRDFYNLSMFRDLVFHVNEHPFTIPKIQQHLAELDLEFVAMHGLPPAIQALYRSSFPHDPPGGTLAHWDSFEKKHPATFVSMYGLVLQKTGGWE